MTLPSLTRREFLEKTTAASATGMLGGLVGPTFLQRTAAGGTGKKGQVYPDERRKLTDPKSGHTVWQLTNVTPDRTTHMCYPRNRRNTADSRWLIYSSDRGGAERKFNLFKMDLRTGESIQLTEAGDVGPDTPEISHSGKEVFFFGANNSFRVVNLETFQEREICRVQPDEPGVQFHMPLSVSPDDKFVVIGQELELRKKRAYAHFVPWAMKCSLKVIRTDNGLERTLFKGLTPLGHVAWNPKDHNLIMYANWGPSYYIQRDWLIHADGTGNRAFFVCINGESAAHEVFSENGQTIYVNIHGGRVPQGMWACNVDGSHERCVLAGSSVGHATVNPEEDRFVTDELYGDGDSLWMARKGSIEPVLLCKMKANWFEPKSDGTINSTRFHPDPRFLLNGQGVTFNSAGETFLVEV